MSAQNFQNYYRNYFCFHFASKSCSSQTSASVFSLEVYLNKLKSQREDVQSEYDRKHNECQALKENVAILNKKISSLNDNLDQTKLDNLNLGQKVSSLKKQIEFYRKLNEISGISVNRNGSDNSFSVRRSQGFNFEICSQVDVLKKETCLEYTPI